MHTRDEGCLSHTLHPHTLQNICPVANDTSPGQASAVLKGGETPPWRSEGRQKAGQIGKKLRLNGNLGPLLFNKSRAFSSLRSQLCFDYDIYGLNIFV